MGRSRQKQHEHRDWRHRYGDELRRIGLPLSVFETAERWDDFVENGHLDWHDDAASFSFEELRPEQRSALHRFLEGEHSQGRRALPLLGWLRVRAAPGLGSGVPAAADDAIEWLRSRGAHAWLVRHHELVLEAARLLVDGLTRTLRVDLDADHVLVGAALHDTGKMEHPAEMIAAGHAHELAGEKLLQRGGFPEHIARVCVTHAAWSEPRAVLEDRVVALADKLWKGKRDAELEAHILEELAARVRRPAWDVFSVFDALCESVAADGPSRLSRSDVG